MDKEEYKRQNKERDEKKNVKRFSERWFKWWNVPSDRFAALIALFTAVLAVVAYFQLKAMRHTDEAINDQLKKARIQNETTREQIRANIATDGVASEPIQQNNVIIGWNMNPRWKNTGSTNAVDYRNWFDIVFIEGKKEKVWGAADCPKPTPPGALVHPNTIPPSGTMVQLAKQLKMSDALRVQQKEGALFFVGHLEYRDVFKGTPLHHHDWCDLLLPNNVATNQFSFIGFFQETD
jgi:hypothetical protein